MNNKKQSRAKESLSVYGNERTVQFLSVEAQQEENYRYWAGLSPEERLEHTVRLIRNIYADQLNTGKKDNRIYSTND